MWEREGPAPGRVVLEDEELLEHHDLWSEDESEHVGWWCVATSPFPWPAPGCTFGAEFMTAAHLVLVWEERDDPNLLSHAARAREVERDPHVVEYAPSFGASLSYYLWEASGRPVHGVREK